MRGERRRPTPHLGEFLHERNRYRGNKPDFYALGQTYPNFQQYLQNVNHSKKTASLPFDNPYAVRELTRTLLQHDFGLDWQMPIGNLCPPVPNRLNYLHWIEDLLYQCNICPFPNSAPRAEEPTAQIRGIDIGTGASCIYALLGAKMNHWQFLATEIDAASHESATANVVRNKLSDKIKVKRVATEHVLVEPLGDDEPRDGTYHFSMCNPPFFGDQDEADTNPDTCCMGTSNEMVCPGGEVAFLSNMIDDSLRLRERVLLYTSMVGRKTSLRRIIALLREKKIHNVCTTEFFQGRTKRWGVAWTLADHVSLFGNVREKEVSGMHKITAYSWDRALTNLTFMWMRVLKVKVLGKRKEAQRCQQLSFEVPRKSTEDHGCGTLQEVAARIEEYGNKRREQGIKIATSVPLDSEERVLAYDVTCASEATSTDATPSEQFEGSIRCEVPVNTGDGGFLVTVEFGSGHRDAFWRFADRLKADVMRSSRQWRRKRMKQV